MKQNWPQSPAWAPLWKHLFLKGFPLEGETVLFLVASILDFCLTFVLLTHPQIEFLESNPLARYLLYGWGVQGMIVFKFLLVAFITLTCHYIARTRLDVARRVLRFGVLAVSAVVVYSLGLLSYATFLV